jgi:hypothetical protein
VSDLLWGCSEQLAVSFADVEGTLEADKRAHMLNMLKAMQQVVLPFVCSCVQTLFNRTVVSLVCFVFWCNVRLSMIEIL